VGVFECVCVCVCVCVSKESILNDLYPRRLPYMLLLI